MVKITKAVDQDLQEVFALLKEVNLPTEGVIEHFQSYFIARNSDRLVGCIGLEIYENVGLMRSVAIHPSFQGQGLGRKLVETIHDFSMKNGLKEIYLLTETAEHYFPKFGYVVIPREEADPKVKQSVEFTTVCADSGICMVKKWNQSR